ncbi:hypothetical protein ACEUZ9_004660 [Paracoccus litorisediminis]|uniref:hypothetical protein n=1 Tax=Paracoccus litorisediminis TaxID=2006130 RepID=UPI003732C6AE
MSKSEKENEIRLAAVRILKAKGYVIEDESSGSGVPKLSRLRLRLDGDQVGEMCAVKVTTSGRIHFVHDGAGSFKVLDDMDLILHACPVSGDTSKVRLSMFAQKTINDAFGKTFARLDSLGKGNLPIWLNPDREDGDRFVGSGFIGEALWSETVSIADEDDEAGKRSQASQSSDGSIMDVIKEMLSKHMGVSPDKIDIDVRVRV